LLLKGLFETKKTTLSALRINPRKKILGAAEGGVSHRWLDYQFGRDTLKQELEGHERIRAIVGPGLTLPKRISQSQRPAFNRGSTSVANEKTPGPSGNVALKRRRTWSSLEIAVAFSGLPDAFDRLLTISVLARLLHRIALECELID
jgi:hypothetical protein